MAITELKVIQGFQHQSKAICDLPCDNLSHTVSKISQSIGQIFAANRGYLRLMHWVNL